MKKAMLRMGLSLMVTLGLAPVRVFCQAPLVPSMPPDMTPPTPLEILFARPQPQPPQGHRALKSALLDRGYCCDSDFTWFGCGNWKTQAVFVFGSCRTFFGEPCFDLPKR